MSYHGKVRQMVADKKKKIKDKEFFLSKELKKHFEDICFGVTQKYGRERIKVDLQWDNSEGATVACTNNKRIMLNAGSQFLDNTDREERYKLVYGLNAHEMGHVLYTNFVINKMKQDYILKYQKFYPDFPTDTRYDVEVSEIKSYLTDPVKASIIAFLVHKLDNIFEDGHIENRLMYRYQGNVKRSLKLLRERQFEKFPTVPEAQAKEETDEDILNSILQHCLSYAKYGEIKFGDADVSNERIQAVFSVMDDIDEFVCSMDALHRAEVGNRIFIKLWAYYKPMIDYLAQKSEEERNCQNLEGETASGSGGMPLVNGENTSLGDTRNTTQIKQQRQSSQQTSQDDESSENGSSQSVSQNKSQSQQKKSTSSQSGNDEEEETSNGSGSNSQTEEDDETGSSGSGESEEDDGEESNGNGTSEDGNKGDENSTEETDEDDDEDGNGTGNGDESEEESEDETNGDDGESEEESEDGEDEGNSDMGGGSSNQDNNSNSNSDTNIMLDNNRSGECEEAEGDGETEYDNEYEGDSDFDAANTVDELCERIAKQQAEKAVEKELKKEVEQAVADLPLSAIHKNVNITIHRQQAVSDSLKATYDYIAPNLIAISRGLQRAVKQKLKDYQQGAKFTGLYFGRRIDKNNLIRTDGKIFYNNRLPQDVPQLAVGILIDESGSMDDVRTESARAMAVILYDFCQGLNIPVNIVGHTTWHKKMHLFDYCEFDSVDGNDKYRLMDIDARDCNRDGAAILYMCERLQKRPEQQKLLFVISDGQPNDDGYKGKAAMEDMASIVALYDKKGVQTIACAIGDDKDNIKAIYGEDRFFDISDLNELPNTMTKKIIKTLKIS